MLKKLLSFLLITFLVFSLKAQQLSYNKQVVGIEKVGTITISEIKDDYHPSLKNAAAPFPGGDEEGLREFKEQLAKKYPAPNYKTTYVQKPSITAVAPSPYVQRNFEGNLAGFSVPNDNDMAISNGGIVVSVINSEILIYNVNTSTLLQTVSLVTFAQPLGFLNGSKFDPKVIYDPKSDRFIIVFLNGSSSSTSKIVVAYSKTNDPTGVWNLYKIPGNPFNNFLWSDYPIIAITGDDLFLTINLLKNNTSWQLGFVETLIWQFNNVDGYNGNTTLNSNMFSGIALNGRNVRNFCPVKGGMDVMGPNMYFLSERNLDADNDTIFLAEVTNSYASGSAGLTVKSGVSDLHYFMPPDARQPGTTNVLATNDSRILGAFLHNNQIQFVQNSRDTNTKSSAIYHGVMTNMSGTPSVKAHFISDPNLDFGYPNISFCGSYITYTGTNTGENAAIITFNHSGPLDNPGLSAVYVNDKGEYSAVTKIKVGQTYIDELGGNNERWGDYSGSQRKYNEPHKVWAAATFGKTGKIIGTWIGEIASPDSIKIAQTSSDNVVVFPNPSTDFVSVNFTLNKDEQIKVSLYDALGQLVKDLLEEDAKAGQNIFTFSTLPLSHGIYFLKFETVESGLLFKKKIVKE